MEHLNQNTIKVDKKENEEGVKQTIKEDNSELLQRERDQNMNIILNKIIYDGNDKKERESKRSKIYIGILLKKSSIMERRSKSGALNCATDPF